jgi:HPt (histidine-containing phosphotransfer) domain-containing protein
MTSHSSEPAPHDEAALERLRRFGGERLLAAMIASFLEHAPSRLDAARAALAAGDAEGVRAALHALRSSAGQLGAAGLAARCAEGEALARGSAVAGLAALVAAADADLSTARAWLTAAHAAATGTQA